MDTIADATNMLTRYRKQAGLTIDEMADKLKVDRTTIMRWEKGTYPVPLKRLDDVAGILGVRKIELRPDLLRAIL